MAEAATAGQATAVDTAALDEAILAEVAAEAVAPAVTPPARPEEIATALAETADTVETAEVVDLPAADDGEPVADLALAQTAEDDETVPEVGVTRLVAASAFPLPRPRPTELVLAVPTGPVTDGPEIVTRMSTSGGRHWGINVGRFGSRHQAERTLLQTALVELSTLDQALRKVVPSGGGFDANFVGMSEEQAALACRRLAARNMACETLGPS